ncbi:MAG: hypothetical protein IJP68_01925 [Selenomonadaceae bacterium]|nr:hypothetical protein [Selenomonadaceae bacterium]
MRVKIISHTLPEEVEYRIQAAINEAEQRGERLKEIHYSTAPAILAPYTKIIGEPPNEQAVCWHNALLIFEGDDDAKD